MTGRGDRIHERAGVGGFDDVGLLEDEPYSGGYGCLVKDLPTQ